MLIADVVATSAQVAATSKRTTKIALMAELIARADPTAAPAGAASELVVLVGFLTGAARQGRIGVGWATLQAVDAVAAEAPTLTVRDVDAVLDELAGTAGEGSQAERQRVLGALYARSTAAEGDFLFRLLTGEMRQGANEGVVADAVAKGLGVSAPALRRAAMFLGDLGAAASLAATGGVGALESIGVQVMTAIQPMLAATSADVASALTECGGTASIEWKLDGARIQVHRKGDEVRVYTRNLNEIGDRLAAVVAAARSLDCQAVVLDGEALGVDPDGRPRLFQDTMSRFGSDDAAPGSTLQPFFFDVLHLDGADLVDRPLRERLAVLDRLAGQWRVPAIVTGDADVGCAFADRALADGHEGVMVKAIDSRYEAGRRGSAWRKVKPVRTLDLVVLAAEWGHGRRRGWLSNLHLGASDGNGGFVMVGKTFKGLTDELLTWQTERLQSIATAPQLGRDDYTTEAPSHTVHVRPELVVEIAVDGVQVSRRYPGGVALRFARVRAYRPDKDPADADLITTLQAMLPDGERRTPPD